MFYFAGRMSHKSEHIQSEERKKEERNKDLQLPLFDFDTMVYATSNFSEDNKLGEGGFGPVYKVYNCRYMYILTKYFEV